MSEVRHVPGNSAERFPIAVEHLRVVGVLQEGSRGHGVVGKGRERE